MKNKKVREKQRKEAEYLKNPDKLLNEVRKLESTAGGKKKAQQQVRENVLKVGIQCYFAPLCRSNPYEY